MDRDRLFEGRGEEKTLKKRVKENSFNSGVIVVVQQRQCSILFFIVDGRLLLYVVVIVVGVSWQRLLGLRGATTTVERNWALVLD